MDLSFLNFIDYVLSPDPVQKRTLMMGFMYHSYLLEAIAGNTAQQGLREVVLAFGLVGFTVLALNRAWWKPSILFSWLVITLIVMLGGRGEVLTLSVDGNIVTPTPAQAVLSSRSMQSVMQFGDNIYDNLRRLGVANGTNNDDFIMKFENGVVARWPKSADGLQQASVYDPSAPIKAYTPIVLTLYAMNRLKTVLLLSLPYPSDMVAMRAKANQVMNGEPHYVTTKYLTDMFGATCMTRNDTIKDAIKDRSGFFYPDTDWGKPQLKGFMDALKSTRFTVQDVENINNGIYPMLTAFDREATSPVVGMVDDAVRGKIPQFLRTTRYTYSAGPVAGQENNPNTELPSDVESAEVYRSASNAADNAKRLSLTNENYTIDLLPRDVLKSPAAIFVKLPKPGTEGSTQGVTGSHIFITCFQMFKAVNDAYKHEVDMSTLNQAAGRLTATELIENNSGFDGTASEALLAAAMLRRAKQTETDACSTTNILGGTTNDCEKAQKEHATLEKAYKEGALNIRLGLLIESQKAAYEPSRLFKSPVRKAMSQLGDLLSPVALWFMALFGGFSTGAYAGIIPTFMSFIMAMIIAATPLMFIVGVLVPSFCPGILMTPVLVLLYLKTVEIMFVVVTVLFSMLKEGVINAEQFSNDDSIASGQALVTSIYDIVVGLVYTSMFMVAGYIFSMGSPDKLLGKLGGLDGIGKIDMKEALQFGGATALASRGIGLATGVAGGAIRAKERVALGKSPLGGGITDFYNKNVLQARNEVAGQIGRQEATQQTGSEFLAQAKGQAIEKGNEARITGQTYEQRLADGDINRLQNDQVIDQAKIKQVTIEQADVKKTKDGKALLAEFKGLSAAERQAKYAEEDRSRDINDDMAERRDKAAGGQLRNIQYAAAYAGAFKKFEGEFKDTAKRLKFSSEADDAKFRDSNGQDWAGPGAVDVLKSWVRDRLEVNGKIAGLKPHQIEAVAQGETLKILAQNDPKALFKNSSMTKDAATGQMRSNISVNLNASGVGDFVNSNPNQGSKETIANGVVDTYSEMKVRGAGRLVGNRRGTSNNPPPPPPAGGATPPPQSPPPPPTGGGATPPPQPNAGSGRARTGQRYRKRSNP